MTNKDLKQYLDDQHALVFERLDAIDKKIEPIARIYNAFSGAGTLVLWMFKYFVVPLSILIGMWYELKFKLPK